MTFWEVQERNVRKSIILIVMKSPTLSIRILLS